MSRDLPSAIALTEIGRVNKPHGLRGELCIELYADSPSLFEGLSRIYLRLPQKKPKACQILDWRAHAGRALVFIDRCQGRDQAEAWRGADVLARERDLPELEENHALAFLGCDILHTDGTKIGLLHDVQEVAGQELWTIFDDAGQEILFPAVAEFICDFDLNAFEIVIDPPPGLLELYQKG